ncbi:MAG TPA: phosphate ABC transporter ATP-binding protein, partial [Bacteroidales bacterium]|nr:phosphate ABC transporter ATP-binding protein [Bacteroidales bacterium]
TAFFYLGELVEYNKTDSIFHHPVEEKTSNYVTGQFG